MPGPTESQRRVSFTVLVGVGILSIAARLQAAVIPPTDLAPGSQYQLIFVTTGKIDATSSNPDDYNALVAAEAALNPLLPTTTWRAVVTTLEGFEDQPINFVPASQNAPWHGLPVYNTQGMRVSDAATNIYAFSGDPMLSAPGYNQFGLPVPNTPNPFPDIVPQHADVTVVWTGGQMQGDAPLGTNNATHFGYGISEFTTQSQFVFLGGTIWLISTPGAPSFDPTDVFPVYALSAPITVPVPEPDALALFGLAMFALACVKIRQRRMAALRAAQQH